MYRIQILKSADKVLRKLPALTRDKVASAINLLTENPRPSTCKKLKDTNYYRIRIGNYTVIYTIAD